MRNMGKWPLIAILLASTLLGSGMVTAQSPYGDDSPVAPAKKVTKTKTVTSTGTPPGISLNDLKKFWDSAKISNGYSASDYKNFVVGFKIIQGKVVFADNTSNYQRVSWFDQILAEHGCQIVSMNKQEIKTKTGWFSSTKTLNVTAAIKGRDFVVQAIIGYYGGSLSEQPASPIAPPDAELKDIVALELKNRDLELEVLRNSFELDKLMVARSKVGALNFSEKNRLDAAIKNLKESKIPAGKAAIGRNQGTISNQFVDLGDKDLAMKQYYRALANYDISMSKADRVIWQKGNAYMGLKDYDAALRQYGAMSGSSSELAGNGIADAYHAKGNDREALNSMYKVLSGFHNSPEELKALAKIDSWGYLKKTAEYPEISGKLSQTYLDKAFLDYGSNTGLATKDYQRSVEIRADGGSASTASKAIVSEYATTLNNSRQALASAKKSAESRFNSERESARNNLRNQESNYDQAVSEARRSYDYDLSRKRRELDDAKYELDRLLRNPPPSGGSSTDPYSGKPSGGNTDPYSTKPSSGGSSTDPYSTKPKSGGSTDPYASKTTTSRAGTDPYGGTSGNTDPYGGSSSGNTDPYNGGYNDTLSSAKARVERLDREYRYLYGNQSAYIEEHTQTEAAALQDARTRYSRYDLSKQDAFISNDSSVISASRTVVQTEANYKTISSLAKAAGY